MTAKTAGRAPPVTALVAVLALGLLSGCSVNPATGESSFTAFMSEAREAEIGADEHPKILERFGGVYDDPEFGGYVAEIGGRLAAHSEKPDLLFTFTLLNSPVINAFALPGGYVYITRGLAALAQNEAELASVLAHEIGHVMARHTAQRYSRALATALGSGILSAVIGNNLASQFIDLGSALYLKGYSRSQEFEADTLSVRYLRRAGYDPYAGADFLRSLAASSDLAKRLDPDREKESGWDRMLMTHPRTADRVVRAIEAASGGQAVAGEAPRLRRRFLDNLDGILYGDDPEQGLIQGRDFFHPGLRFRFTAPPGFRLYNTPQAVLAKGPGGARVIFDADGKPPEEPFAMTAYIAEHWAKGARLSGLETIEINGLEAATAETKMQGGGRAYDARLVAIRFGEGRIYRFVMATPTEQTANLNPQLRRMTYSFRRLSEAEAAGLKPYRLRVVQPGPGDTVARLAASLPFEDFREERFRVLNALTPGEALEPGRRVKIIAE